MNIAMDFRNFSGVSLLHDKLWHGTILSRDTRSLSVLAVDRFRGPRLGGQLSAHPYWELVAVLSGDGELLAPAPMPVRTADVLLIPPGLAHGDRAEAPLDTVWIAIAGDRLRDGGQGILRLHDLDLCRRAEDLWLLAAGRADRSGGELDGLALALLGRFLRRAGGDQGGDLMDQAVRWLHQHLDRPVQVGELAHHLRISPAHLHRLFKRRTRTSPKAFLNALRLERAAHLLRQTSLPATRIASMVGFADPLYFSRAFTRATGTAPSRFRGQANRPAR